MLGKRVIQDNSGECDPAVKRWRLLLDMGIKYREKQEARWTANEACDDMRQWQNAGGEWVEGSGDEPTINKIGSFIRTYRAAISYKNPRVKMTPKNASGYKPVLIPVMGEDGQPKIGSDGGIVVRPVLPYQARERLFNEIIAAPLFGLRNTLSRIIKAGCLAYGAAMVGYKPMFATPLPQDTDDEIPILPDGTLDFSGFEIDPMTGVPMMDDDGKPIKKNRMPVHEEWFFDWVHYRHLIHDPRGGNDFMNHRWVAIEEIRTLEEVKADPLYKNTEELQATGSLDMNRDGDLSDYSAVMDGEDDDLKLVRLFRIFDMVKDRMIVLADGHGKALYDEVMPRGITHCPLGFFRPNEVIGKEEEFYPRAPVTDAIPLVTEKNVMRKRAFQGANRSVRKILMEPSLLGEDAQEKITNDVDMEIVPVEKATPYGLEKAIHILHTPGLSQDVWASIHAADSDFDEVMGQGAAARGRSTGDTATETNKRSQYEITRYDFDRQVLADFLREMFKKLDDSIDANMTIPRAIHLIGEDGQTFVGLVDRDLIACDVDIDIDVTEMAPVDGEAEAARMIQFAQMAGQNPWLVASPVVLRTMAERLRIRDENFIEALSMAAQAQMAMAAGPAQPKVPEAGPPQDEAQAMKQNAGGTQIPRDKGAE